MTQFCLHNTGEASVKLPKCGNPQNVAHPQKKLLSSSQSSVAYSSCPGMRPHEISPTMSVCQLIVPLFRSCLRSHSCERLFYFRLPAVLTLTVFKPPLSLRYPLSRRCKSCDIDLSIGLGFPMIYRSLHGFYLELSVLISICWEKFL